MNWLSRNFGLFYIGRIPVAIHWKDWRPFMAGYLAVYGYNWWPIWWYLYLTWTPNPWDEIDFVLGL
jgi:hypothetical protein